MAPGEENATLRVSQAQQTSHPARESPDPPTGAPWTRVPRGWIALSTLLAIVAVVVLLVTTLLPSSL